MQPPSTSSGVKELTECVLVANVFEPCTLMPLGYCPGWRLNTTIGEEVSTIRCEGAGVLQALGARKSGETVSTRYRMSVSII
jgi:hypothetical protein